MEPRSRLLVPEASLISRVKAVHGVVVEMLRGVPPQAGKDSFPAVAVEQEQACTPAMEHSAVGTTITDILICRLPFVGIAGVCSSTGIGMEDVNVGQLTASSPTLMVPEVG